MNVKETVETIQNLVAENQTRQAAELLYEHLKAGGVSEKRTVLGLLGRIKKLEDQIVKNIISGTDADLENSKINEALLYLADELAAGRQVVPSGSLAFSWKKLRWPVLGTAAAVLVVLAVMPYFRPSSFDLVVNVKETNGSQPMAGEVKVQFGDKFVTNEKPLDKNGRVVFEKNLAEYLNDTITLIPVGIEKYRVVGQTAMTAAQSKIISFTLNAVPDTAMIWGTVMDVDKKPAANAKLSLELDGKYITATTDGSGKFQLLIPNKKDGDSAPLKIEYEGEYRYNKRVTFSKTTALIISLNPNK